MSFRVFESKCLKSLGSVLKVVLLCVKAQYIVVFLNQVLKRKSIAKKQTMYFLGSLL